MKESEIKKLVEKIEEKLKDNVLISFSSDYSTPIIIITQRSFIYKDTSNFSSDGLLSRTLPRICRNMFNTDAGIWYVCPLEYKDMVMNSTLVAQAIIEEKFKDSTLNKIYERLNQ